MSLGVRTEERMFGSIRINVPFGGQKVKGLKVILGIAGILAVILVVGQFISAEIFHASKYQKLMPIAEREFVEE